MDASVGVWGWIGFRHEFDEISRGRGRTTANDAGRRETRDVRVVLIFNLLGWNVRWYRARSRESEFGARETRAHVSHLDHQLANDGCEFLRAHRVE